MPRFELLSHLAVAGPKSGVTNLVQKAGVPFDQIISGWLVANFADNLDKIGRGLDTALKGYNTAVGSFEGMLLPGARKLAELGAKGAKELTSPSNIDTAPRNIVKLR